MKILRRALIALFAASLAVALTAGRAASDGPMAHYHHWAHGAPVGFSLADLQHNSLNPGSLRNLYAEMSTAKSLGANTIRLQVMQDHLVGPGGHRYDAGYMGYIESAVNDGRSLGLTMVINDQTEPGPGFHLNEARPTYATRVFWTDVMRVYADTPRVVFDLFNEPRHISWQVWYDHMQPLVTYVNHHAHNTIWLEGKQYGCSLAGMPKIHGKHLVYTFHHPGDPWPGMRPNNAWTWDSAFGNFAARGHAVVDGEYVNSRATYHLPRRIVRDYLAYAKAHHIGMIVYGLGSRNLLRHYLQDNT